MIAYIDDFMIMSMGCLLVMPLLLLVKPGQRPTGLAAATAAAETAH